MIHLFVCRLPTLPLAHSPHCTAGQAPATTKMQQASEQASERVGQTKGVRRSGSNTAHHPPPLASCRWSALPLSASWSSWLGLFPRGSGSWQGQSSWPWGWGGRGGDGAGSGGGLMALTLLGQGKLASWQVRWERSPTASGFEHDSSTCGVHVASVTRLSTLPTQPEPHPTPPTPPPFHAGITPLTCPRCTSHWSPALCGSQGSGAWRSGRTTRRTGGCLQRGVQFCRGVRW